MAAEACSASWPSFSRSGPKILMPTGVLIPVASMLMRFSMGKGHALATPGRETTELRPGWEVPSASIQPNLSSEMVMGRSLGQKV